MKCLDNSGRIAVVVFSLGIGAALGAGFLSTALSVGIFIKDFFGLTLSETITQFISFPLLAFIFYVSIPFPKPFPPADWAHGIKISILPLIIALVFGAIHSSPGIFSTRSASTELIWNLAIIPIGEELLFRGWILSLAWRLWGSGQYFSLTNPLPVAVWASAIAFSAWHFQNISVSSFGMVSFQAGYCLMGGLWLGYLRWKLGRIWPCILAHALLNFLASIF